MVTKRGSTSAPLRSASSAPSASSFSEVVEAEGHLIDSQILNVVFDTVVRRNASFDVLKFSIGRSNDEPSFISMRISSPTSQGLVEVLEELVGLGCRLAEQHDAVLKSAIATAACPTTSTRRQTTGRPSVTAANGSRSSGSAWTR